MGKFCILGDTHLGCRNDLTLFHKHFDRFFDMMIAELVQQDIKHVFQLGDLFDRRKHINFQSLKESKRYFFNRLQDANITLHTLVGNHDIFFRESLQINSQSLVLGEYDNIVIYDKPQTVQIHGATIDIIPWICKENEQEIAEFIKTSSSDICMGHFEISGFAMYRGMESHEGLSKQMFEKYERVFSGHYHTRSQRENITYVGTPYEMTWQDCNDPRGFHIFNTTTRDLTFVQNPDSIFVRIDYNDQDLIDLDTLAVDDRFVKVVVVNKTDLYKFDQFMGKLYNKGCYEIKVVEDLSSTQDGDIDEDVDLEDTVDVMANYVDSLDTDVDKQKIKTLLKTLFVEALNSEVI